MLKLYLFVIKLIYLKQIKESSTVFDQTSDHKESIRRTSSIQISIQPSSSREIDNDRNSSGGCCKFA